MTFEEMPPVMLELFRMLPPVGTEWPIAERVRWLHAFEAVCRLIFKDDAALEIMGGVPLTGPVSPAERASQLQTKGE